jgi:hypothetical protein
VGESGKLFFAIGVDVDPAVEADFNEWYDTDHLPTVVGCPGFVTGCRYEVEGEGLPRFWAVYEVESKNVMKTPELRAIAGFGRFEQAILRQQRHWFTSLTPLLHAAP